MFDATQDINNSRYMIIDHQAIDHLDLAEVKIGAHTTTDGSLLEFIDHTKTLFGKRQLRKWLLSPLLYPEKINDRLDAVEDIMKMPLQLDLFRMQLEKLPDLEKILARVFVYSVQNSIKAVHFENVHHQKLREFKLLLKHFRNINSILTPLR